MGETEKIKTEEQGRTVCVRRNNTRWDKKLTLYERESKWERMKKKEKESDREIQQENTDF